ncbi:MAG TPA: CBS domain-containing protein [Gemmatimonadales bacterium]|nr:CBS domain-containing protein [Gemmatimonadales bacterium]
MGTTRPALGHTVGDVMNRAPTTLPPGARVRDAVRRFRDEGPSTIAVVDSAGTLCGIVTVLDLLRVAAPGEGAPAPSPRAFASRTVETVMRPGVITLEASDRLDTALDLLIETRFHALPVVQRYGHGPVLVGMLEQRDLLPVLSGGRPARQRVAVA